MDNLATVLGLLVAIVTIVGANFGLIRYSIKPLEAKIDGVKEEVAVLRATTDARFAEMKTDMDSQFAEVRADIRDLRQEIREIDRKHDLKSDAIRQDIFYLAKDISPNGQEYRSFPRTRATKPAAA